MRVIGIETPHGTARAHLHPADGATAALVLGHGAGGGVGAADLVAVTEVALAERYTVVLVEQPYRVAGRRSPPRAPVLDAGWTVVLTHLRNDALAGLPLVAGGRSSGARVACRTAAAVGASAVLCLAFPLQPAARAGREPAPSRLRELDQVEVPVLVVQGERDPFGMPPPGPNRTVVAVGGDHALRSTAAVRGAARPWLAALRVTLLGL